MVINVKKDLQHMKRLDVDNILLIKLKSCFAVRRMGVTGPDPHNCIIMILTINDHRSIWIDDDRVAKKKRANISAYITYTHAFDRVLYYKIIIHRNCLMHLEADNKTVKRH